jgi:ABC-type sugar transport system substrate-binding protein
MLLTPKVMMAGLATIALALPVQAADTIKVGLITKFPVPFYSTMEDAAKKYAAAHPEVELVIGQGQAATDIEGQIALIESMITQGVQGLAITPVDPTVAPALDKAVAAGIKVVLVDNGIPDWKGATALVSTNNLNGGKIAGEYLRTVLKAGDKIGILEGVPGVPALDDRVTGMMQGLGDLKVEVVGKGATNCTLELGTSVAEDILTANPDLKAIYAACGPPIPGAVKSIANAGIANDEIILVGFDACCGELEAIKAGTEDASVAQFPAKMGELGIDTAVKAIRGEAIEANVDTGAGLVTLENVKDFE